jgi:hypothetical protein
MPDSIIPPKPSIRDVVPGFTLYRLEVIKEVERDKSNKRMFLTRCSCEAKTEKVVRGDDFIRGKVRSCGCIKREMLIAKQYIHGRSHTREYNNEKLREYRRVRGDEVRAKAREYYSKNRDKRSKGLRDSYKRHIEARLAYRKKYVKENYDIVKAGQHRYRARKRQAAIAWASTQTDNKVRYLQKFAQAMYEVCDIKFHIDHIVPLSGHKNKKKVVCGLHIWYNLQLMLGDDNCSKSYYTWPDM